MDQLAYIVNIGAIGPWGREEFNKKLYSLSLMVLGWVLPYLAHGREVLW